MNKKTQNQEIFTKEPDLNFDWDLHISNDPRLKVNKNVKLKRGDNDTKVYCHEDYAQIVYDIYSGNRESLKAPNENEVIQGVVTSIGNRFATIDINWREDALLDLSKEEDRYIKYIQEGFPIEVLIENIDSKKSVITASYTKNLQIKKRDEILSSIGKNGAYLCTVKELIHGGYFVDIDGIECFMPGSLGGMNKLVDFNSLLNEEIYVVPINYSREKDYIVVSHRDYLKTLIEPETKNLEFGKEYEGFVTGCSKHGIFVEFNRCLTGLIPKNSISKELIKDFEHKLIKPGQIINFYVSDINNDKISLSQYPTEEKKSGWADIEDRYEIPSTVKGKIKKIVNYGMFIEIEPKIVGLLHKSHIDENFEFSTGEEIEVKIVNIDKDTKKIDFEV